ncbi:MAG: glycosyltransferase family 2 protein [Bdellovibrionales bacterium]
MDKGREGVGRNFALALPYDVMKTMAQESTPLITVGIPTFNRPEGLARTLARIIGQTYTHLEILVSDNHSDDARAVEEVLARYHHDKRLRFFRQERNLGSIGNFEFLVRQARGDFFLWAADDDELESTYVEALLAAFRSKPGAAVAMTGYDVLDEMAMPHIRAELTRHLFQLSGPDAYTRLRNYIRQPDHLGKSRLVWGMFPRPLIVRAFEECQKARDPNRAPVWADLPIELRMLSYGDLAVAPQVLFHVHLLPTSDGKNWLSGGMKKLMSFVDRSVQSQSAVVRDAGITSAQKRELHVRLRWYELKAKLQLLAYYGLIGRSPWLARQIKKIWFALS